VLQVQGSLLLSRTMIDFCQKKAVLSLLFHLSVFSPLAILLSSLFSILLLYSQLHSVYCAERRGERGKRRGERREERGEREEGEDREREGEKREIFLKEYLIGKYVYNNCRYEKLSRL
jgi:hypothetical protein